MEMDLGVDVPSACPGKMLKSQGRHSFWSNLTLSIGEDVTIVPENWIEIPVLSEGHMVARSY